MGLGGYKSGMPKWDEAESQMISPGVTPVTLSWSPKVEDLVLWAWGKVGPTDRGDY